MSNQHSPQPFCLDTKLVKLLEELQEGKQFNNKNIFPEKALYLKLALDYSFFRKNLLEFCVHLDKIKGVIRPNYDTIYILCLLEVDLLNLVFTDNILEICLPRFVSREDLRVFNNTFTHITITAYASVLCFTVEEVFLTNQEILPQNSTVAELQKSTNKVQTNGPQRHDFIVTLEIKLNKTQITFLIGAKGTRIESLREKSGASIKIIPISDKMTAHERNHPESVQQTILISGDLYSIALAVTSIESALITLDL
nr:CMF_HP1_G0006900.mRNA.1.CDS.1 [Saccharomyces cerevisiae]